MNPSDAIQPSAVREAFISYNNKDRASATKLAAAPRDAGIVVINNDEMPVGQGIPNFIEDAINSADVTILLVVEKRFFSGWVAK